MNLISLCALLLFTSVLSQPARNYFTTDKYGHLDFSNEFWVRTLGPEFKDAIQLHLQPMSLAGNGYENQNVVPKEGYKKRSPYATKAAELNQRANQLKVSLMQPYEVEDMFKYMKDDKTGKQPMIVNLPSPSEVAMQQNQNSIQPMMLNVPAVHYQQDGGNSNNWMQNQRHPSPGDNSQSQYSQENQYTYEQMQPSYGPSQSPSGQTQASYGQAQPSYQQASPSYEQSQPFYSNAEVAYEQARNTMGQVQPSYEQAQTSYGPVQTSYGQAQPVYGQSQPRFEEYQPRFEQTQPSYEQPQTSYEQPQSSYEQLQPRFEQIPSSYEQSPPSYDQGKPLSHPSYEQTQPQYSYEQAQPPYVVMQPSYGNAQPTMDHSTHLPSHGNSQNSFGGTQPPFETIQISSGMPPSTNTGSQPMYGIQTPYGSQQPSYREIQLPPVNIQQIYDAQQLSNQPSYDNSQQMQPEKTHYSYGKRQSTYEEPHQAYNFQPSYSENQSSFEQRQPQMQNFDERMTQSGYEEKRQFSYENKNQDSLNSYTYQGNGNHSNVGDLYERKSQPSSEVQHSSKDGGQNGVGQSS